MVIMSACPYIDSHIVNTHYVIVRTDVPPGVQAAMLIHAAGESSSGVVPRGTFAVALGSPSEHLLLKLENRLMLEKVSHAAFREPDRDNQLMSIGIEPVGDRRVVRRFLKGFTLLGASHEE